LCYLFLRSRSLLWEITCDICFSQSGILYVTWWFLVISSLLRQFYFSLCLNNTPLWISTTFSLSICQSMDN
jgi:hypothetical protein